MSMYSFARTMMAPFAKHNPFIELVPGMEPLTKSTEGWMEEVSEDAIPMAPDPETVAANLEKMASAMPGYPLASNLMAHPIGAAAAGSAITMGIAGQMMGTMYGAMTGMMEGAAKAGKSMPDSLGAMPSMDAMNPFVSAFMPSAPAKAKSAAKPKAVVAKKVAPVARKAAPVIEATVTPITNAPAKPKAPAKSTAPAKAKSPASAKTNGVATPKAAAPMPAAEPVAQAVVRAKPVAPKAAAAPKKTVKSAAKAPVAKTAAAKAPATKAPAAKAAPAKASPAEPAAAAAIMPEDFVQPAKRRKPGKPDDLKQIAGVGPKLEQVLNGLGIWTFGQIADWSPSEVAWVDDYLQFKGRIDRDGWIDQAKSLTAA